MDDKGREEHCQSCLKIVFSKDCHPERREVEIVIPTKVRRIEIVIPSEVRRQPNVVEGPRIPGRRPEPTRHLRVEQKRHAVLASPSDSTDFHHNSEVRPKPDGAHSPETCHLRPAT